MATKGASKGRFNVLEIGGILLLNEQSHDINADIAMIDASSKSSGVYAEFIPDRISQGGSASGIVAADEAAGEVNYIAMQAIAKEGAETGVPTAFRDIWIDAAGDAVVGTNVVSGVMFISNVSKSAPDADVSTFSMSFQVTGATTEALVIESVSTGAGDVSEEGATTEALVS
jgi:hypothetical protein